MIRRPPIATRTYTLFPYTTLFLSHVQITNGKMNGSIGTIASTYAIFVRPAARASLARRGNTKISAGMRSTNPINNHGPSECSELGASNPMKAPNKNAGNMTRQMKDRKSDGKGKSVKERVEH